MVTVFFYTTNCIRFVGALGTVRTLALDAETADQSEAPTAFLAEYLAKISAPPTRLNGAAVNVPIGIVHYKFVPSHAEITENVTPSLWRI